MVGIGEINMTHTRLSETAQQMLALIIELPSGTGYPLSQLGAHLGTGSIEELRDTAVELEAGGFIRIIQATGVPEPIAFLVSENGNSDAPLPTEEKKSIISDVNIDFFSANVPPDVPTKMNVPYSGPRSDRGQISTSVMVPNHTTRESKPSQPSSHPLEQITIKQILEALSLSIENSSEISVRDKWPLIEKINTIVTHSTLQATLASPLKKVINLSSQ
jgi:hypothetical protein